MRAMPASGGSTSHGVFFMALAAGFVWFRVWEPLPRISVIGLFATLVGGYPIFREAF